MDSNTSLLLDLGEGLSMMLGLPRINTWDTKGRPAEVKKGAFGFNTSTKSLEYYDGKSWYSAALTEA